MFDKLKQLKELGAIKKAMESETETVEKDGVKVTVSGNFEIVDVVLNKSLDMERNQKLVKECANDATKKVHMKLATKF